MPQLITATNYLRARSSRSGEPGCAQAREWFQFCILAPALQLLINFNLNADTRPGAAPGATIARVFVLARRQGWEGAVETFSAEQTRVRGGQLDLEIGKSRLLYFDGTYHLRMMLAERSLVVKLDLEPLASPLRSTGMPLGDGVLNRVVVPALHATGEVWLDGKRFPLESAPTYHTHHWGAWRWGSDFAWQWGFGLPSTNGWTLVYNRMEDRSRSRDSERKLCLWRDGRLRRTFSERDLRIRTEGVLHRADIRQFPQAGMRVSPDASDTPRLVYVSARSGVDALDFRFHAEEVAQLILPNETDPGVTVINEVAGRLEVDGRVEGEAIQAEGEGVFETVQAG